MPIPKITVGKEIRVVRDDAYEIGGIVSGLHVVTDMIDTSRIGAQSQSFMPGIVRTYVTVSPWGVEVELRPTDDVWVGE